MAQPVGKAQEAMDQRIITRGKKSYQIKRHQVYAEYDDRGIGNFYKAISIIESCEDILLIDPDGMQYTRSADEIVDKLMSSEWGNSTDAEFQQRKKNIERMEYDKFRRSQRQPSPIGTAQITIGADTSEFEAKMDRAIAKLKEFIALSEKAQEYK